MSIRTIIENGYGIILIFARSIIFKVFNLKVYGTFLRKLGEKRQTREQQKQASHAISLYYKIAPAYHLIRYLLRRLGQLSFREIKLLQRKQSLQTKDMNGNLYLIIFLQKLRYDIIHRKH